MLMEFNIDDKVLLDAYKKTLFSLILDRVVQSGQPTLKTLEDTFKTSEELALSKAYQNGWWACVDKLANVILELENDD